jgi:hypothetical protein
MSLTWSSFAAKAALYRGPRIACCPTAAQNCPAEENSPSAFAPGASGRASEARARLRSAGR